jgi:hypothetical protein
MISANITLNDYEKELLKKLDEIFEKHKAELKQLNKQWKKRICFIENIYRRHLRIPEVKPDDYLDDIPILKEVKKI